MADASRKRARGVDEVRPLELIDWVPMSHSSSLDDYEPQAIEHLKACCKWYITNYPGVYDGSWVERVSEAVFRRDANEFVGLMCSPPSEGLPQPMMYWLKFNIDHFVGETKALPDWFIRFCMWLDGFLFMSIPKIWEEVISALRYMSTSDFSSVPRDEIMKNTVWVLAPESPLEFLLTAMRKGDLRSRLREIHNDTTDAHHFGRSCMEFDMALMGLELIAMDQCSKAAVKPVAGAADVRHFIDKVMKVFLWRSQSRQAKAVMSRSISPPRLSLINVLTNALQKDVFLSMHFLNSSDADATMMMPSIVELFSDFPGRGRHTFDGWSAAEMKLFLNTMSAFVSSSNVITVSGKFFMPLQNETYKTFLQHPELLMNWFMQLFWMDSSVHIPEGTRNLMFTYCPGVRAIISHSAPSLFILPGCLLRNVGDGFEIIDAPFPPPSPPSLESLPSKVRAAIMAIMPE